jgi:hypothetical protein
MVAIRSRWLKGESCLAVKTHSDMLRCVREASRCIKILDNISLRGGFWPGACAAAILDLQHALQKKVENDASGARNGNLTRSYDIQRPFNGLNQARHPLANLNGHTKPLQSASNQQSFTGNHTSGGNSQPLNPPSMLNTARAPNLTLPVTSLPPISLWTIGLKRAHKTVEKHNHNGFPSHSSYAQPPPW